MESSLALAIVLIIGHLIAIGLILSVIVRQRFLFGLHIIDNVSRFRLVLFYLSISLLVSNVMPILLDTTNMLVSIGFLHQWYSEEVEYITYTLFNCASAILSATAIWILYRTAAASTEKSQPIKKDRKHGTNTK